MFKSDIKTGEFLQFWLESIMKGSVRYGTYVSYRGYIKNHVNFVLADIPLAELRCVHIQELVARLIERKTLSSRTICIVIRMLSTAFSYAEDYEQIDKNPCRRVRLPKIIDKEVEILNNAEQTRVEKAALRSADPRLYGVVLSLYTGLRIGELCALRWVNVDLSRKCIYIRKQINRTSSCGGTRTVLCEVEPKTEKSRRTVMLPDFIVRILRMLKKQSKSEFVFSMRDGTFVQPRTMQNLHKKLLRAAKVKYAKFHVTRHTFATRAAEINADPKTVSDTLGHTNTSITLNRYTHSMLEQKQKMMRGLNTYFTDKSIPNSCADPFLCEDDYLAGGISDLSFFGNEKTDIQK